MCDVSVELHIAFCHLSYYIIEILFIKHISTIYINFLPAHTIYFLNFLNLQLLLKLLIVLMQHFLILHFLFLVALSQFASRLCQSTQFLHLINK